MSPERTADPHLQIRELLYGDAPLRLWAGDGAAEPWTLFAQAADCLEAQDEDGARQALRSVLALPDEESRHYLQAWTSLRALGEAPPAAQAKHLYGAVLDIPTSGGCDTLAAYEDGGCRYLNFSGGIVVWDTPDEQIGGLISNLLDVGRLIAERIGPWEGPRPDLPEGQARLSFLCPSGLHFGQGPLPDLMSDQGARALVNAGLALLQALIARTSAAAAG
jgi:hypothetical protein